MARKGKYTEVEQRFGKPMPSLLIEMFELYGNQVDVAKALGVTQSTVSVWVGRVGLKQVTRLVPAAYDYSQYFSKPMDRAS